MSQQKTATKRSAEERIERYKKKIRKAEQLLEEKVAEGPSAYIVGKYKNRDSNSSNESDISDNSVFDGGKEISGGDNILPTAPIETRPEKSPGTQKNLVVREAHSSRTKPQTYQNALEAGSSRSRSVRPVTGLKAKHSGSVRQSPESPQARNNSAVERNDMLQNSINDLANSRNELANSRNESRKRSETMQEDNSTNNSVLEQSTELLNVFSSDFSLSGENVHFKVVEEWDPILKKGLSEKVRETILQKYTTPDNCKLLKAPSMNNEVAVIIDDHARHRDKNAQLKQDQMGLGLTAIAKGITTLIEHRDEKYEQKAMVYFRQGCLLVADLHFEQTKTRRVLCGSSDPNIKDFICRVFGKDVHARYPNNLSCIDVVFDRDDTLFGLNAGKVFTKCVPSDSSTRRAPHS